MIAILNAHDCIHDELGLDPLVWLPQVTGAFKKAQLLIHTDKLWGLCEIVGGLPAFQKMGQIFEIYKVNLELRGTPSLPANRCRPRENQQHVLEGREIDQTAAPLPSHHLQMLLCR